MDRKTFAPVEMKLDEAGSISLAFAQLNVIDKDGDVTLPGAVPEKDVPMSAYGHTSWDGELPVGKGTISEVGDWAVFTGAFFMDTTAGRETHATIKALGPLAEYSYGYRLTDFSFGEQDGQNVRFLRGLDIYEVSPVLVGVGVGTHTRAIKGAASALGLSEHLDWVTVELATAIERAGLRADLRAKEGRVLSTANRDRLTSIADAWRSGLAELDAILADTDPGKSATAHRHAMDLLALMGEARALGVQF